MLSLFLGFGKEKEWVRNRKIMRGAVLLGGAGRLLHGSQILRNPKPPLCILAAESQKLTISTEEGGDALESFHQNDVPPIYRGGFINADIMTKAAEAAKYDHTAEYMPEWISHAYGAFTAELANAMEDDIMEGAEVQMGQRFERPIQNGPFTGLDEEFSMEYFEGFGSDNYTDEEYGYEPGDRGLTSSVRLAHHFSDELSDLESGVDPYGLE